MVKQAMREELLRRLQNDNNTGDGGTEMDPVIKQILPIPEGLTAMIRCETENGKKYYFDANATGGTVVYALVEDGFGGALEFYTTDCNGIGELQEHDVDYVMLTPTIHCQKCGRRMLATTTTKDPDRVIYRCICGETFDDQIIVDMMKNCENPEG